MVESCKCNGTIEQEVKSFHSDYLRRLAGKRGKNKNEKELGAKTGEKGKYDNKFIR